MVAIDKGAEVGSLKRMGIPAQDQLGVYINCALRSIVAGPMPIRVGMPKMDQIDRSSPQAKVSNIGSCMKTLKYGVIRTITMGR